MQVLIAGAGIGGLTAALSLHAVGIEATVIESARELRPLGVGINLLPHAVRELTELGLGEDLAHIGVATAENVYCDRSGKELFTEPRGIAGGYRWPQYSVHRGQLQMMLLSAVHDRLGPHALRTGTRLVDFEQDAGTVRVRVPGQELEAEVLVGADGLHSAVRAQLHPDQGPLLWSGVRMWRGVTEAEPFLSGRSMAIARGEENAELIAYPIGPSLVNWVGLVPVAEPGPLPGDANWNHPGRVEDVLRYFGDWDLGWLDVPALIRNSTVILEYPMVDRDPLPWWGQGRVTLLGDAAHPMYPVGANGASQAIVDARVLAGELAREFPEGLVSYEKTRREATAAVIAANREMQRTGDARSPEELVRITQTYRRVTGADAYRRVSLGYQRQAAHTFIQHDRFLARSPCHRWPPALCCQQPAPLLTWNWRPRFTQQQDGTRHIVEEPPLITRLDPAEAGQIAEALDSYLETLPSHWARILAGYSIVDVAHKGVGVQARRSAVARFVHGDSAWHAHQGQRVVEYQQALQTVSEPRRLHDCRLPRQQR